MAAVDPSESPKRPKFPAEEEEACEGKTGAAESTSSSDEKHETSANETTESPDEVQRTSPGNDGGCTASHSEVSVEPGAGAEKTTCNSPENPPMAEKTAKAPGNDQQDFDWSETEENDEEAQKQKQDNQKSALNSVTESAEKVQQDTHDDEATDDAEEVKDDEENSHSDAKHTGMQPETETEKLVGEVDGAEDVVDDDEEADQGEGADQTAKPKAFHLVCKECGKRFTRRETFNLHRHFHAHEDELTPLTCKECGLTFQHRSSLIKHRNEHKEKEERLLTPKKEVQTMEVGNYKCAECQRMFSTVGKLRDHSCCNTVEKPYHCPLCRQEFQFKVSVTKHMMAHSQESNCTCQECSQTFPNSMALRYHQRCHTALKPYECPECGMVFKHYSVMEDHRRKHTDNTRSHLCNICGKTFKYSSLLHQHQYLHTGQKPFRCPECGKKFAFAQNMKAHCRQHRRRETNFASEQASKQVPVSSQDAFRGMGKENTNKIEEPKRTFNCPLCPQTYSAPANLRAHMLIHEAEYEKLERTPRPPTEINKVWDKGLTCPHCPGVFPDESTLNVHLLSFHKSVAQYVEEVPAPPKKQFIPVSSSSAQGKWRNEGLKSYKCSECAKTFRHRSVLELHMRIHAKDKPYQCKVCGKGFRFSSYLQQHLIIHTGKKPYKCPDCGKDFAFMQNMKTHQRLHQEKPFRCTSCRKGYSDETQLQQHMLSHNGEKPHKCDQCDKSFGLAYLLRDHMNTHTGERPHHCNECNKSFSWFSSLLVHQKIHARKRQGFNQYNSPTVAAKTRGRGRRGGRPWGWSRQLGGSGMVGAQPSQFPVSSLSDAELHRRAVQTQASMLSSRMDLRSRQQKEPWLPDLHPQPVQWKVDGGEIMPVPSSQQQHAASQQTLFENQPHSGLQQHHQRSPGWADNSLLTQSGSTSAQSSESSHVKDGSASTITSFLTAVPQKSSPSAASEMEQHRQPKPATWSSPPTSTVLASTSSLQHDFSVPSYIDGAALWSVRPALSVNSQSSPVKLGQELQLPRWPGASVSTQKEPSTPPKKEDSRVWDLNNPQAIPSTVSQPEKPWNGCELQNQWAPGLAGASTSAQIDQSSAMPISTPVSHGVGSTLWDIQTPPGIPKTINSEKLVNNHQEFQLQQKQVTSSWANVQSQASQKVPISIQYEPHRFGQGLGTPVWGFQSSAVGPQALLTGQLKPGNGQELQQQPMVTGTQIIINQPSPFFSPPLAPLPPLALPGPHPLHSVAVGALSRPPPPNIFFTPQAVMNERPHMPQTLSLPQLTPRTEPHKLGPRLPFAPDRLLQCMICGCSLQRELDLQMHYLQHAQGEI
ncbi:uncharacterized protein zgc:66448 isoform X1 [Xyrichtys novacula]|uniref:Uncharacterized protein zgc:66448 isoform X1 n=1 Tax=Xyrichtys novacula TaxID=13765 RepID=A0AAV1FME1_XYRNO|nr:uncharacterized protein zgc:66448 isoform X1 [Xyrichtys novacula]